ncbi:MAG TPA: EutN/CcmL family microcompartment protein [Spirochaetia bacterium]|nr:EutN/CcmL family microcompartment protein [Spirochaetia bacterium]
MVLARIKGNVVATEKHPHYRGYKILIAELVTPSGKATGKSLLALDGVQAGVGDLVLLIDEGGSARQILGDAEAVTVRTVIAGIVDRVDIG